MQLPLIKTALTDLSLLSTKWKSLLDPILKNPMNEVSILSNIPLAIGSNKIPHLLGSVQRGWFLVDINGVATIYRSSSFNASYLYLTSSAVVTVSLGVF